MDQLEIKEVDKKELLRACNKVIDALDEFPIETKFVALNYVSSSLKEVMKERGVSMDYFEMDEKKMPEDKQ